jgi:hypothetical protein
MAPDRSRPAARKTRDPDQTRDQLRTRARTPAPVLLSLPPVTTLTVLLQLMAVILMEGRIPAYPRNGAETRCRRPRRSGPAC